MSKSARFMVAFMEALKTQSPYWALAFAIGCLNIALASQTVEILLTLACLYVGIGAFVVFVKLKEPRVPCEKAFDFKAAQGNIYRAAWWPWYVFNNKRGRG